LKNTGFPVERQQREERTGEKKNTAPQDKTNTEYTEDTENHRGRFLGREKAKNEL
jgi:hypothetical protein